MKTEHQIKQRIGSIKGMLTVYKRNLTNGTLYEGAMRDILFLENEWKTLQWVLGEKQ